MTTAPTKVTVSIPKFTRIQKVGSTGKAPTTAQTTTKPASTLQPLKFLPVPPKAKATKKRPVNVKSYKMRALSKKTFDELRQFGKILFIDLKITPINPEMDEQSEVYVEFKNCLRLDEIKNIISSHIGVTGIGMWRTINYTFQFKEEGESDCEKSEELF